MKKIILLCIMLVITAVARAQNYADDRNLEPHKWLSGEKGTEYRRAWVDLTGNGVKENGGDPFMIGNLRISSSENSKYTLFVMNKKEEWEEIRFKFSNKRKSRSGDVINVYVEDNYSSDPTEARALLSINVSLKDLCYNEVSGDISAPNYYQYIIICNFASAELTGRMVDAMYIWPIKNK